MLRQQASSIALLGVTALAGRRTELPSASLLVLPVLFTAGMTLVDSADNVLMMCAPAAVYCAHAVEHGLRRGRPERIGKRPLEGLRATADDSGLSARAR